MSYDNKELVQQTIRDNLSDEFEHVGNGIWIRKELKIAPAPKPVRLTRFERFKKWMGL